MSKGPSQVGTKTTSTIDPLRQAQAPYLAGGWESAKNLLEQVPQTPYGGPTYAMPTPEQYQGYGNLYNAGVNAQTLNTQAYAPFQQATSGQYGVQNSPAYSGFSQLAGGNSPEMQQAAQNANMMSQYGQMGANYGQNYGNQLGQIGATAGQAGQQYAGNLSGVAAGLPGTTQPYMDQLGFNAATANAYNPAFDLLGQQASGQYLNSNPYIDKMFSGASDAVTRAYQTATAPRTESSYAAAGRYGSPSLGGATSVNQRDLGSTLNNLASNIYGTQYQNERQLQDAAARAMGEQYISGLGQSTGAAQAAGQLGLGTAQQQASAYNAAGNQALTGLSQQGQNLYQGGQLGLSGYNNAVDALARSGALGMGNTQAMMSALSALQGGYQSGNAAALQGAQLAPSLIQGNITGANAQTQAGAGYQGLTQAQYDDAQRRYLAQQASPWSNLQNYMGLLGQPTGASSISQQPIYGSPAAQALGLAGGVSNLFGGKGGSGGSGTGVGAGVNNYTNDVPFGAYGDYGGGGGGGGTSAGGILGGLGGLGSLFNFLPTIFSDRRLKEDTRVIGNLGSLPIHAFNYKGDPVRRIGFMADEVEKIDPGAVVDTSIGFKAVNYGRAAASALAGA